MSQTYEGLNVPKIEGAVYYYSSDRITMHEFCRNAQLNCNCNISVHDCSRCLFNNLETFTKWFKETGRSEIQSSKSSTSS